MRLREDSVFLRWNAGRDVISDGTFLRWIATLEAIEGRPFASWRALDRSGPALELTPARRQELVVGLADGGTNPQHRFELTMDAPRRVMRVSFTAGAHPYTGRYVVGVDLRLVGAAFGVSAPAEPAGTDTGVASDTGVDPSADVSVEAWVARFRAWMLESAALCGHAHDTDDDAMQNIVSPALLRSGYGVDPETLPEDDRPGRELSRGEHRYAVNWLTWLGPEMASQLDVAALGERSGAASGAAVVEHVPVDTSGPAAAAHVAPGEAPAQLGPAVFIRLYDKPSSCAAAEARAVQRAVFDALGIAELARRQQRAFGFWQRKS